MSLLRRIENSQPDGSVDQPSKLQQLRGQRSPSLGTKDAYTELKNRIQQKLIAELDPGMDVTQNTEMRSTIQEMFETMFVFPIRHLKETITTHGFLCMHFAH